MILLMTNPVRSAANSDAARARRSRGLDFLVAVDFYINETTRHAHIILPTPSPAEQANYEVGLYLLSVRNVAKWSWPAVPPPPGAPETLAGAVEHRRAADGPRRHARAGRRRLHLPRSSPRARSTSSARGRASPSTRCVAKVDGAIGPERIVDMLLRIGPYGDGFGRRPDGLTLAKVQAAPHGIDLGPLAAAPARGHQHRERRDRARAADDDRRPAAPARAHGEARRRSMVLIGRRDLRCSNSFMHNLPALVKGRDRCTLQVSRAGRRPHRPRATAARRASPAASAASSRRSRSPTT